jgi:hypothetical protein
LTQNRTCRFPVIGVKHGDPDTARPAPGGAARSGDVAAANLTITPERQKLVDFDHLLLTGSTKAAAMGFDPNRWFQNVELAAARVISREPVRYVRTIYKHYVAYRMLSEQAAARRTAKGAAKTP